MQGRLCFTRDGSRLAVECWFPDWETKGMLIVDERLAFLEGDFFLLSQLWRLGLFVMLVAAECVGTFVVVISRIDGIDSLRLVFL